LKCGGALARLPQLDLGNFKSEIDRQAAIQNIAKPACQTRPMKNSPFCKDTIVFIIDFETTKAKPRIVFWCSNQILSLA
jgi:hypothetical protein